MGARSFRVSISIGLLGAGRIGAIHGASVIANPRAKLAAIAEPDREMAARVAGTSGAKLTDIDAILSNPSIDAVIIATPTDTHAEIIEKAARAGKAIFCEKPIDLDIGRVRACLEIVEKTGIALFLGFNRRFDPSFASLKHRLPSIGAIELLAITSRDPGPPPISYIKRSGGLFKDMMIHDFDMARWLLGEEPVEIHVMASNKVDPAIGQAGDVDTAIVNLRTPSGALCQISNSRRAIYGYDQRIEVHGSQGMIRADNWRGTTVEVADGNGYKKDPLLDFFLERYAAAYRAELDSFIDILLEGKVPSPSGRDGMLALHLADAAMQSFKTGLPVSL